MTGRMGLAAVAALFFLVMAGGAPVLAADKGAPSAAPSAADVQWAQTILKEKGFDPGRANGEFTARTRAALLAYQKSVGLPGSGLLDPGTVGKMLAERQAHAPAHGGTLGAPSAHHKAEPVLRERDVAPRAAPTTRVTSEGSSSNSITSVGTRGPAPAYVPPPAHVAAAPPVGMVPHAAGRGGELAVQAAPRTAVQAAPGAMSGNDGISPSLAPPGAPGEISPLRAPGWVRTLIYGLIGAVLAGFGFLWWRAGQPHTRAAAAGHHHHHGEERLMPRFEDEPHTGDTLRGTRLSNLRR